MTTAEKAMHTIAAIVVLAVVATILCTACVARFEPPVETRGEAVLTPTVKPTHTLKPTATPLAPLPTASELPTPSFVDVQGSGTGTQEAYEEIPPGWGITITVDGVKVITAEGTGRGWLTPMPAAPTVVPPTSTPTSTPTYTLQPTAAPPTPTPSPERTLARVVEGLDGDTIKVDMAGTIHTVHYTGIDAPEITWPPEWMGPEAARTNRLLVEGKGVYLEKDVSDTDSYGRLLRYVFLEDGTFANARLVRLGYAEVNTNTLDVRYRDLFLKLQQEAKEAERGLWGPTPTPAPTATSIPATPTPVPTVLPSPTLTPAPEEKKAFRFTVDSLKEGKNEIGRLVIEKIVPRIVDGTEKDFKENVKYYEFPVESLGIITLEISREVDERVGGREEKHIWRLGERVISRNDHSQLSWGGDDLHVAHFAFDNKRYVVLPDFGFGMHEWWWDYCFNILEEGELKPTGTISISGRSSADWDFSALQILGYQGFLYLLRSDGWRVDLTRSSQGTSIIILRNGAEVDLFYTHLIFSHHSGYPSKNPEVAEFIVKDEELYLRMDNNYCFHAGLFGREDPSSGNSLFVCISQYYGLSGAQVVRANEDFKSDYLENAEEQDLALADSEKWQEFPTGVYPYEPDPDLETESKKDWVTPLILRTLNYLLAGETEKARQTLEEDFHRLSAEHYSGAITLEVINRRLGFSEVSATPAYGDLEWYYSLFGIVSSE